MNKINLVLPLPPSINHSHITTKSGKRIRSTQTKQYMKEIYYYLYNYRVPIDILIPTKEKIIMDLWFYFPDNRRRDTHNGLKILLDALEGILYKDDKCVLPRIQDFQVDKNNPRVEIEITLKD